MRQLRFAGLFLALAACQGGRSDSVSGAYAEDVHRICNVEQLSGALELSEGERSLRSAYWLERNLKTAEGRKLAASIAPLQGAEKGKRLAAEAQLAGLPSCPTADTWR